MKEGTERKCHLKKILWNRKSWISKISKKPYSFPLVQHFKIIFSPSLQEKMRFTFVVGEDAQPCSAHSPMALNDLYLALAHIIVVQMKKIFYILSFHIIRDQKPFHATVSLKAPTIAICHSLLQDPHPESIIKDSDPKHWPTSFRFKKTAVIIPGNKLVGTKPL